MWARYLSRRFFRPSVPLLARKDYYSTFHSEILGVPQGASDSDIKKAYFSLAKQYHPDVNKAAGAKERFAEINEYPLVSAYQTLGNADKRRMYENTGMTGDEQDQAKAGFGSSGGFDFGGGFNPFGGFGAGQGGPKGFGFGSFQDILNEFEDMFGTRQEEKPYKGEDITATVELEFLEAVHGSKKTINVHRKSTCSVCNGTRTRPGSPRVKCSSCGGSGHVYMKSGPITFQSACTKCKGKGVIQKQDCSACSGQGTTSTKAEEVVNIPKGVETGQTLRMAGKGHRSEGDGPAGDILLKVKVKAHPLFKRDGLNITSNVYVTVAQAVLGATVEVDTVEGPKSIRIEPGSGADSVKALAGLGASATGSSKRGDHLMRLHIQLPRRLSAKQRQLFEALQAENL